MKCYNLFTKSLNGNHKIKTVILFFSFYNNQPLICYFKSYNKDGVINTLDLLLPFICKLLLKNNNKE